MTTSLCCRAKTDPVPRETMPTAAKDSSDPQRQRMKDNGERSSRDHRLAGWKRGAASGTTDKTEAQLRLFETQFLHNDSSLFNKSYPDSPSPPYLPPRLNSKQHPP